MVRRTKKQLEGIAADAQVKQTQLKTCTTWGDRKVLTDEVEINYYHEYLKQIILRNKLLGSVSDSGNYNLKDRIKRDLVKMQKEVADASPSYYIAMAIYMKKTFNFAIEVDFLEDGMASATLYVNEVVDNYPPVTALRSFVAKVILPYDASFEKKVYKAFNLVDGLTNIKDTDVPFLATYMQSQIDDELLLDEISDLGSQIYIMRMLKVLSNGGELGKDIIEEYKKKAEASKLDVNKKGAYTKLHRTLDEIIEKKGGLEKLPLPKSVLQKPRIEYTDSIRKLESAKSKKKSVAVVKEEGAQESGGGAPKVAGKGGKSGGDKKKPAKKADKPKKKADKKKDEKKKDEKKATGTYGSSVKTIVEGAKSDKKSEKEIPIIYDETPTAPAPKPEKPDEQKPTEETPDEEAVNFFALVSPNAATDGFAEEADVSLEQNSAIETEYMPVPPPTPSDEMLTAEGNPTLVGGVEIRAEHTIILEDHEN